MEGARHGACFMVGGERDAVEVIDDIAAWVVRTG